MLKSVVTEAMYRLRCWKVAERFNSPYYTRGEIGGTRFRSLLAISNSMIEAGPTSNLALRRLRATRRRKVQGSISSSRRDRDGRLVPLRRSNSGELGRSDWRGLGVERRLSFWNSGRLWAFVF